MLLVDSDIIIDSARGDAQAKEFLRNSAEQNVLAISTITRLELLAGCRNALEWTLTETTVRQFSELELTPEISRIAVSLFEKYRLSHGIAMADGFIAATALSNRIQMASKSQRHFRYIENLNLLPYLITP
jgi:predicted nucleic acid-binding protein